MNHYLPDLDAFHEKPSRLWTSSDGKNGKTDGFRGGLTLD